jgi:hypothetical protein
MVVGFINISLSDSTGIFDRKATCLPHAPFDFFSSLPQMRMTGIQVAPCIQNGNNRFVAIIFVSPTPMLFQSGTMAEQNANRPGQTSVDSEAAVSGDRSSSIMPSSVVREAYGGGAP